MKTAVANIPCIYPDYLSNYPFVLRRVSYGLENGMENLTADSTMDKFEERYLIQNPRCSLNS